MVGRSILPIVFTRDAPMAMESGLGSCRALGVAGAGFTAAFNAKAPRRQDFGPFGRQDD
jgi:hypothetical protein